MALPVLNGLDLKNKQIINLADPSSATDATTKQYVDNLIGGLANKRAARVKTTGNVNLTTALVAGQTIDGKVLATGDRVFVGSQTTGQDNGIYVSGAGAAVRSFDFDAGSEIPGALIIVSEGTTQGDTMWLETTDGPITVGTTVLSFTQFSVGVTYTADGQGIELSSTTFALELDGSSLSKSASGVKVANAFVTALAGAGLVEASQILAVGAGTGIVVNANDVAIDPSVVVRKFAANCVATTNPQTFTDNLATLDKTITVVEVSTGKVVLADITEATTNTFTVDFGGAPTAAQYRVIAQA